MIKMLVVIFVLTWLIQAMAQDLPPGSTEGYADSGGVKIHYVTTGKGPLMVLIHGFPEFWYSWRQQMPEFAKHYQVVAVDMRGYNLSDKPEGVDNYRMPLLVADVMAVVKRLGQSKAVIVGHDWGGAVAWGFAMTFPQATERLVILNAPHPKPFTRELANNPAQQKASEYARNFQKPEAAKSLTPELLTFWVKDAEAKRHYVEALKRSSMEGMLNFYKANYPREPYAVDAMTYPKVKCPTLIVWGLQDPYILAGCLNGVWEQVDAPLTLVTFPNARHFVQHDEPQAVTTTILRWLGR